MRDPRQPISPPRRVRRGREWLPHRAPRSQPAPATTRLFDVAPVHRRTVQFQCPRKPLSHGIVSPRAFPSQSTGLLLPHESDSFRISFSIDSNERENSIFRFVRIENDSTCGSIRSDHELTSDDQTRENRPITIRTSARGCHIPPHLPLLSAVNDSLGALVLCLTLVSFPGSAIAEHFENTLTGSLLSVIGVAKL